MLNLTEGQLLESVTVCQFTNFAQKRLSLLKIRQGKFYLEVIYTSLVRIIFSEPLFQKISMVLQKCWAKLYGSYQVIIGGLPNEALHAFSSAPVYLSTIYINNPKKQKALWNDMVQGEKNGALLCCGTRNDDSLEKLGFVKGHAYTILGVYQKPMRLIKLRNPWGYRQWKGKASDYDTDFWSQISPEDKQTLEYQDSKRNTDKDGVFFMVWQDFIKYFLLVDICKINDNAHYNFVKSEFNHLQAKLFQFQVRGSQATVTFAVTQANKRGTNVSNYSRSYMVLGKWDETTQTYKYVKSFSDRRMADVYMQVKATPGKYVLYVKYMWINQTKNKAVVSVYSLSPVNVEEMKGLQPQNFLTQIFFDHAMNNPKKIVMNDKGDWFCNQILLNQGGFSYFVVNVNQESKNKYGVKLNPNQYAQKNLHLNSSLKSQEQIQKQVSAGKPFVAFAQLLCYAFPEKQTNPTPTVLPLS